MSGCQGPDSNDPDEAAGGGRWNGEGSPYIRRIVRLGTLSHYAIANTKSFMCCL